MNNNYIIMKKEIVNKNIKKLGLRGKKQKGGGTDVVGATINLVDSMVDLGKAIFGEIKTLTQMGDDINGAASPSSGTPGQIQGPKEFNEPKLK
jgi:hypothetical protein